MKQGFHAKKAILCLPFAIHPLYQNVQITVRRLDYPDQVFIEVERIPTGAFGSVADFVERGGQTPIDDGC